MPRKMSIRPFLAGRRGVGDRWRQAAPEAKRVDQVAQVLGPLDAQVCRFGLDVAAVKIDLLGARLPALFGTGARGWPEYIHNRPLLPSASTIDRHGLDSKLGCTAASTASAGSRMRPAMGLAGKPCRRTASAMVTLSSASLPSASATVGLTGAKPRALNRPAATARASSGGTEFPICLKPCHLVAWDLNQSG